MAVFWIVCIIIIAIFLEWLIGYAIGNAVSKDTGVVLGIVLILLGFSIIIGITIIVCSQKNKPEVDVNINLNMPQNNGYNNIRDITPNNSFKLYENRQMLEQSSIYNDQRKCPFCAEIIKKEALVCRFCGKNIQESVWENILLENNLGEYIEIFEKNNLTELEIISELNEADLEKLGINIMGDRKKILKVISLNIFPTKEIHKIDDKMGNKVKEISTKHFKGKKKDIPEYKKCKKCGQMVDTTIYISCPNCECEDFIGDDYNNKDIKPKTENDELKDIEINDKWICGKCGNVNDLYLINCKRCNNKRKLDE